MKHRFLSWLPIGWALRKTFAEGYHLSDLKADLQAAFVVSLIALPLSMALAISVGLPPQNGIYTAIVAGMVASFLGGSSYQISGPTAAFVVILIPIVSEFGLHGMIWCQIFAGILLILFGIMRLGKLIHYVPETITIGFTAAIAMVLFIISLKDLLGLPIEHFGQHFSTKIANLFENLPHMHLPDAIVGLFTLFVIILARGRIKLIPSPIIGITAGTLLAILFHYQGYSIMTIGSQFQYDFNGIIQQGLPPYPPVFQLPTFDADQLLTIPSYKEIKILLIPALLIALLAALESLLSASIADKLTQTRHQPDAELKGIGMANILTGLASGIPATAAIARTATNIQNGARSPISGIIHAFLILLYVLLFSSVINFIPMSALAALLILTAYYMSHLNQFSQILLNATLIDKILLVTTFVLTVLVDMVVGIGVGMALALLTKLFTRYEVNTND